MRRSSHLIGEHQRQSIDNFRVTPHGAEGLAAIQIGTVPLDLRPARRAWRGILFAALIVFQFIKPAVADDCLPTCAPGTDDIRQIDPYPLSSIAGARSIPDFANGGTVTLSDSQLIDVVILGDGYLEDEQDDFFEEACEWYQNLYCPEGGIRPYNDFAQAFRVHAVFTKSAQKVNGPSDANRQSYYRLLAEVDTNDIPTGMDSVSGWWNAAGDANDEFRTKLFAAIDSVAPLVNTAKYPSDLYRPAPPSTSDYYKYDDKEDKHQDYWPALSNRYSNLIVVMMIRMDGNNSTGGASKQILSDIDHPDQARRVMVAFGVNARHEFGHAFADLFDEYIHGRDMDARFSNPEPSVFLLWNVSFSNDRCDLLWPHLAPGGRYNPNVRSPIGRLFMGGYCALNVWHSEYVCLMNGKRDNEGNYECDVRTDAPSSIGLRAYDLCFWCQEIVVVRILEKTGQFARSGDPSDINDCGETWYRLWDSSLRDAYYRYFDVSDRIAARNADYASSIGQPEANSFLLTLDGDGIGIPSCLLACGIVEYGNAIYVKDSGNPSNSGSRSDPLDTVLHGIEKANDCCASTPLVSIQPGSYRGAMTLSRPAIVLTDACESVVIGK